MLIWAEVEEKKNWVKFNDGCDLDNRITETVL